jgi:SNF2 family DNA or RNA helicase
VFSQFTRFLALIRKRLEAKGISYEYLDGRTPAKVREQRVAAFQSSSGPPVFCISLKAGGHGPEPYRRRLCLSPGPVVESGG